MVDVAALHRYAKPTDHLRGSSDHRVPFSENARKDVVRGRDRLELGSYELRRSGITVDVSTREKERGTRRHRVPLRRREPSSTLTSSS